MPYDNDLFIYGPPIIDMLRSGTENSDVVVILQADFFGSQRMRRYLIRRGDVQVISQHHEDSSDRNNISSYLRWAYDNFEADHWIVSVVGHGGRINEISPDDHGSTLVSDRTWMEVDQFAAEIENFNKITNHRVDLLFFQNCNKATLEVIYETRNCARYTLASQRTLGAPNYYYGDLIKYLDQNSESNGYDVATAIMDSERLSMYHTMTLVDNRFVHSIPEKLAPLVEAIANTPQSRRKAVKLPTYRYFEERHCDALAFLQSFDQSDHNVAKQFKSFSNFLRTKIVSHYRTGGTIYGWHIAILSPPERFCGLSVYLPETIQSIDRYGSMALNRQVGLSRLYEIFLEGVETRQSGHI